jgi:hypothetical protein
LRAPFPDALLRLPSILGNPLPPDLEAFYLSADGMRDNHMDGWYVSFWSIERIMRDMDVVQRGERFWWAFADVLIDSWFFRICPEGARTLVFAESTQEVFESLQDFLEAYVDRPDSLDLFRA